MNLWDRHARPGGEERFPPGAGERDILEDRKLRILICVGHFLPGWKGGGPIRSITAIIEKLGDEFDFRVVTSDRDLHDATAYQGIAANRWTPLGKAEVYYLSRSPWAVWRFVSLLRSTRCDVLYLSSLYTRRFSMLPIVLRRLSLLGGVRVVVAPRGELADGVMRFKHRRKRWYLAVAKRWGLYDGVTWHASSAGEADDIRRVFGAAARFAVASPMAADVGATEGSRGLSGLRPEGPSRKARGSLRVVFLSRISRSKNLDGALRMLASVSGPIQLHVFGPIEDPGYWQECREIMRRLPPHVLVQYGGQVSHDDVQAVLRSHHLLFLPTLGESFGHVIVEALLAGLPVLTSDRTPWRELERKGAGWNFALAQPQSFIQVLEQCMEMEADRLQEISEKARAYGRELSEDATALLRTGEMFRAAARRSTAEAAEAGPKSTFYPPSHGR
jgi:glycosyltransferase involved in cell wall biosynthesis